MPPGGESGEESAPWGDVDFDFANKAHKGLCHCHCQCQCSSILLYLQYNKYFSATAQGQVRRYSGAAIGATEPKGQRHFYCFVIRLAAVTRQRSKVFIKVFNRIGIGPSGLEMEMNR